MKVPQVLKSWFQLIRLPAGFSILSNILAAHVIALHGNIEWVTMSLTLAASLSLYFGGMILNDCFDYQEDTRDRPQRPLPSGQVALKTAWIASFVLLLTGCLFAFLVNLQVFGIALILSFLIIVYDSNILPAWPRAITMGLCRYSNWLMALAVVPLAADSFLIALPVFFYVVGLTRLSQLETTHVPTARAIELVVILVLSMLLLASLNEISLLAAVMLIALAGYLYFIISPAVNRHSTPARIQQTVGQMVMGLILLDAAISLSFGHYPIAILLLLLLPQGRWTGKWLYVS